MVFEIIQKSLGILILKKEYIENETQTVEKRGPPASQLASHSSELVILFRNPL